jgi:hypothetical protein
MAEMIALAGFDRLCRSFVSPPKMSGVSSPVRRRRSSPRRRT